MPVSSTHHPRSATGSEDAGTFYISGRLSAEQALGVLRIEIHGSWSVADLIKLLGRLEDGYKAAAALESLTGQPSGSSLGRLSADDLLQTVTAFQLAGGLRLGSLRYGSPGFVEVIGALNPLKTVKDGITENREINRKRDETRRLDEREREQQAIEHEEAMARESRMSDQQQQSQALDAARLRMEAEAARFNMMKDLIDRLPAEQQSVAAAQLLQILMGATEEIANDARIDEAKMLQQADSDTQPSQPIAPPQLADSRPSPKSLHRLAPIPASDDYSPSWPGSSGDGALADVTLNLTLHRRQRSVNNELKS
jgi:hypothetical protein